MGRQAKRQEARLRAREAMPKRRRVAPATPSESSEGASTGCPRCGAPVRYVGRGRRPIWCSARCRTAASIERRGNRIVGVQPIVVQVTKVREVDTKPAPIRHQGGRRTISDWVGQLDDLNRALVIGSVYERELEQLIEPINGVLNAFRRRYNARR